MIAKVNILLPYSIIAPEKEPFDTIIYDYAGYKVRFYPFGQSENADKFSPIESATINGEKAVNVDVLQISFNKEHFDRKVTTDFDPPLKLIEEVANDFLSRLRYVTNAHKIKILNIDSTTLSIRYLNNDESELIQEEGFARGKTRGRINVEIPGISKEIWSDVSSMLPTQLLPAWKHLLLDAKSILPEIGPSIILTFTALEVFISTILNEITIYKKVNDELWQWINNRGPLKDPSIDEQFDKLSKYFIGKSLKENDKLWEVFKNLRTARNSFAHTGIPKIGNLVVDETKARQFIIQALEITKFFRDNLPTELRWPEYNHDTKFEATLKLINLKPV